MRVGKVQSDGFFGKDEEKRGRGPNRLGGSEKALKPEDGGKKGLSKGKIKSQQPRKQDREKGLKYDGATKDPSLPKKGRWSFGGWIKNSRDRSRPVGKKIRMIPELSAETGILMAFVTEP